MSCHLVAATALMCLIGLTACQQQEAPRKEETPGAIVDQRPAPPASAEREEAPPTPPLREDFEGEPKLSLFPRVGDFCPEESDKEGLSYWLTFIDHLIRTSGPIKGEKGTGFAIRGIKSIDSVGFFSPLAVAPDTSYQVSFRFWAELPEGGLGGAGVLEFDEFLWVPGQYPRSLSEKHFQRAQPGVQLSGDHAGTRQTFTFRTGPKTRMIHLVFFREGTPGKEPMVLDDVEIAPVD